MMLEAKSFIRYTMRENHYKKNVTAQGYELMIDSSRVSHTSSREELLDLVCDELISRYLFDKIQQDLILDKIINRI